MAANDPDGLWLSITAGLIFVAWLDHLVHAVVKWRAERTVRAFRNMFIAIMLQVGLFRLWLAITLTAFPNDPILLFVRPISGALLSLLLLSGAFVVAWTWRRSP